MEIPNQGSSHPRNSCCAPKLQVCFSPNFLVIVRICVDRWEWACSNPANSKSTDLLARDFPSCRKNRNNLNQVACQRACWTFVPPRRGSQVSHAPPLPALRCSQN